MHINKVVVTLFPVCGASVVVMEIVLIVVKVCKHVLNQSFWIFKLIFGKPPIVKFYNRFTAFFVVHQLVEKRRIEECKAVLLLDKFIINSINI